MGLWSKVKNAAKKIAGAVGGLVTHALNVAGEIIGRIIGVFGFILDMFVPWPRKKMRVRVLILNNEDGSSLNPSRDLERDARDAYDLARSIFKREANVKLVSYGSHPRVKIIDDNPPKAALEPGCGLGAVKDHYSAAGRFFLNHKQYSYSVLLLGNGSPITVFVVRSIDGLRGCSSGALTDYVTVTHDGLIESSGDDVMPTQASDSMAHEIGHACGLDYMLFREHNSNENNLMNTFNKRTGSNLTRTQVAVLRNSRFVTYL